MSLSLSSTSQSHVELSRLAEKDIADRLRALPGVAEVQISGNLVRELSVLLRSEKLRMHNISVAEVENSLRNQNLTVPGGKLEGLLEDNSIRLIGRLATPGLSNIVIGAAVTMCCAR
jgi:HAE1 family hydrophobic/amphiphilic exporter-1